uniref:Uncharacterized protein n=1 Tax=Ditylenchus dipsaci TaxID=166011 RepID=A0A915EWE6_9BILA
MELSLVFTVFFFSLACAADPVVQLAEYEATGLNLSFVLHHGHIGINPYHHHAFEKLLLDRSGNQPPRYGDLGHAPPVYSPRHQDPPPLYSQHPPPKYERGPYPHAMKIIVIMDVMESNN